MWHVSLLLLFVCSALGQRDLCRLDYYNEDDDLALVNPHQPDSFDPQYPVNEMGAQEGYFVTLDCCATGFSTVVWKVNGTVISPDGKIFIQSNLGMVLTWEDPIPGQHNFTCELAKNTGETLITPYWVKVKPSCKEDSPYFSVIPSDRCAREGDEVNIVCEVVYADNSCIPSRYRLALITDAKRRMLGITYGQDMELNTTNSGKPTKVSRAHVHIPSISKEDLGKTYWCFPKVYQYMKREFTITECSDLEIDDEADDDADDDDQTEQRADDLILLIAVVSVLIVVFAAAVALLIWVHRVRTAKANAKLSATEEKLEVPDAKVDA